MDSELINLAATCVSTIAACVSTYFAAKAIKDARESRQEDFEAARPFFSFANFGLKRPVISKAISSEKELLDPRFARIEGLISNDGKRHASNVRGVILLIPIKAGAEYGTFKISIADDVSPGVGWNVGTANIRIIPEDFSGKEQNPDYFDPGFFVLVFLEYGDFLSSKKYKQTSFMRWVGISNGVISGNLAAGTKEEWDAIIKQHSDFLRAYVGNDSI